MSWLLWSWTWGSSLSWSKPDFSWWFI
jgi:hypothetical protein